MGRSLIALIALLSWTMGAGEAAAQDHKYVGIKKCRSCHKKELMGNQYEAWEEGVHAKAFQTLKSPEAKEIARKKGLTAAPHEAAECLKCHVTAHGVDPARIKYPLDPAHGVQCESCHGPGNDYRKKKVMADHDRAVAKGMWEPGENEQICTACHNKESPSWDPAKGFDFAKAKEEIAHPIPKDVKGRYLELEKQRRAQGGGGNDEEEEED